MNRTVGFTVIYRWTLKPGREDGFQRNWRLVTEHLRDTCGGLGSRLHRADDGTWVAYAQWPDRRSWAEAEVAGQAARQAMAEMSAAVAERHEPVLLEPVADLLVAGREEKP